MTRYDRGGPKSRHAALTALTDLVDTARKHRDETPENRIGWRHQWDNIAQQLDATRTTLVQEGDDYLDVAWAMIDSGRLTIARSLVRAERRTR
jgi:hypothetical protein